jgi:hypothetical protein
MKTSNLADRAACANREYSSGNCVLNGCAARVRLGSSAGIAQLMTETKVKARLSVR